MISAKETPMLKKVTLSICTIFCLSFLVAQYWDQHREGADLYGLEIAIKRAVSDLVDNIPRGASVAVVQVRARDFERIVRTRIARHIETNLVQEGVTLHDRNNLQIVINERGFQAGIEADAVYTDQELITLGEAAGTDMVLVATLDAGFGTNYTLTLELINVKTTRKFTAIR